MIDQSVAKLSAPAGSLRARGGAGAVPDKKESMTETVMLSPD